MMQAYTMSPALAPAYTCGTHVSVLDLDSDSAFISTTNPSAKEFVPSYYPIDDASEEARRVDDIIHLMHHLVGVHDSEMESLAQQFADAEYPIDDREAFFLDQEDALCGSLHAPTQKPKGCTYSRKNRDGHQPRSRRQSREAERVSGK